MENGRKSYYVEYYSKNKEKMLDANKKWRQENKEKFTKIVNRRRKEVADELKEQGQMYVYYPKTQRENKMIQLLCKTFGMDEVSARKVLENADWNIKSLLKKDFVELED